MCNLMNDFALKMKHSFFRRLQYELFEIIGQRWILHYFAESQIETFEIIIHPVDRNLVIKNMIKAGTISKR